MATQEQLMQKITELEKEIKQLKETISSLTGESVIRPIIRPGTLIRPSNVISPVNVIRRDNVISPLQVRYSNVISPVNAIRPSGLLVSPRYATYTQTPLFGHKRQSIFSLRLI